MYKLSYLRKTSDVPKRVIFGAWNLSNFILFKSNFSMSLSKPLCITPVAPTIAGTILTLVNLHNVLISTAKSLYARILSRRLWHTLLSFGTASSMTSALLFVLLITMMSGLLCCRAWSVWTAKLHKILAFAFSSTVRDWCWYHAVWFS